MKLLLWIKIGGKMKTKEILKELVSFKTDNPTDDQYSKCAEYIAERLKDLKFEVEIVDGGDGTIVKPNVIAEKNFAGNETILFSAHYDVVPADEGWNNNPWTLTEKDGKLFGRGTSDDKGAIAAFISAMEEISPAIGVKAIIACDEEVGGEDGLGYITKNHFSWLSDISMAWIADASTAFVGIGASGVLGGEITVYGKGGHAGYPHKADNAVHRLVELMTEIREYENIALQKRSSAKSPPGSPYPNVWGRFSMTMLKAGAKTNIIPEKASMSFDLRYLPEETRSAVENEFRKFFDEICAKMGIKAELKYVYGHNGYIQPITTRVREFGQRLSTIFSGIDFASELGGNDGPFLFELGIPTVAFGPIDPDSKFHMPDEFIRIDTLKKMVQAIKSIYGKSS